MNKVNNIIMSQVISVSIPDQIMNEVNAYIPKNKRSMVVANAFSQYLKIIKRKKINKQIANMYDNLESTDKNEIEELSEASFVDELLIDEL